MGRHGIQIWKITGNPMSTVVIKSKNIKYDKNTFRSIKIALPDIYEVWKFATD